MAGDDEAPLAPVAPICHLRIVAGTEEERQHALDELRRVGLRATPPVYRRTEFLCSVVAFNDAFVRLRLGDTVDVDWTFPTGEAIEHFLRGFVGDQVGEYAAAMSKALLGPARPAEAVPGNASASGPSGPTGSPYGVLACAESDRAKVRSLHSRLRSDNVECWFDAVDLVGGQNCQLEIDQMIREASFVVFCFSSSSVSVPGDIHRQLKVAVECADRRPERSIFIVPALLEPCTVPERISRLQRVELYRADGYDRLLRALRTALGS